MSFHDIKPEHNAFFTLLRSCSRTKNIYTGHKVHADLLKKGLLEQSPHIAKALVNMYVKCGALTKAKDLLVGFRVQDAFSWTALISGYAQQGQGQDALNCFEWMQHEGVSPDAVTFACALRACAHTKAISKGEQIHEEVVTQGLLGKDIVLGNALVDMYVKCGALVKAARVLEELPARDVITWNALIAGYAQQGQGEHALHCFERMEHEGLFPDRVTFACILKACGSIGATTKGKEVHDEILKQGLLGKDIVLCNALVDMYAKCGALTKAQQVLDELPVSDVVSWNTLIARYAQQGQGEDALICFERMKCKGVSPDIVTFTSLLKACGSIKAIDRGEQIHDEIARQGILGKDIVLGNALVDMYAKCGALTKAQEVLEELPLRNVVSWNALITGCAQQGQSMDALTCFAQMQREGLSPNAVTFACILKACGSIGAADKGEQIHYEIASQGLLGNNSVLGNALVDMYAKCGAFAKALQVLKELPVQNVNSWNALMIGYTHHGQNEEALNCFEQMQDMGPSPDALTFACALRACGSIGAAEKGKQIHDEIAKQGLLGNNIMLGNALLDMYAKCGALAKAQQVLEELPAANVYSWNALTAGYVQHGQAQNALNCFECMQDEGFSPDVVTFTHILKACGSIRAADRGEEIHFEISRQGLLEKDVLLGNVLLDMYVKCGALAKAQQMLGELHIQNVLSWNALITGFVQKKQGQNALDCFEQMQHAGLCPDAVTYVCILKACSCIGAIDKGKQVHDEIAKQGLLRKDLVLGNALVDMYCKCGALTKALEVLEELPARDVVTWNAIISGYAQQDQGEEAWSCFERMQCEGLSPNAVTFSCILKACGSIGAVDKGEHIHDEAVKQGLLVKDIMLGNALVDMYVKCGVLRKAQQVLDELSIKNVVSWNALIAGYAQKGQGHDALKCFERMHREGISPDAVTFTCILKACGSIGATNKGEEIHDEIAKQGFLGSNVALGNALVDMYIKFGSLKKAQEVFEELSARDVVSWNTLIAGYAQQGQGQGALNYFERMQREGLSPDSVTFACILKACGTIGAADKGEQIHDEIAKQGLLQDNVVLGNALVNMYAKCGALSKAHRVLEELPVQDVASWNALIAGYAHQGQCQDALNCFEQMQGKGLSPDAFTFSCMLNACCHSGLVEEGEVHFAKMGSKYGIKPEIEHFICMLDLYGRTGHLDKAVVLIKEMPSFDYPVVWCTVLGACQKWGDVNVAKWAFKHSVRVNKNDAAPYILMANIYSDAGMHEDAESIRALRMLMHEKSIRDYSKA